MLVFQNSSPYPDLVLPIRVIVPRTATMLFSIRVIIPCTATTMLLFHDSSPDLIFPVRLIICAPTTNIAGRSRLTRHRRLTRCVSRLRLRHGYRGESVLQKV